MTSTLLTRGRPVALLLAILLVAATFVLPSVPAGAADATATISGRVTLSDGTPARDATVLLRKEGDERWRPFSVVASGRVDGDGVYRFTGLSAGLYRVEFRDGGNARFVHGGAPEVDEGVDVPVGPGQQARADGQFEERGGLSGDVRLPEGDTPVWGEVVVERLAQTDQGSQWKRAASVSVVGNSYTVDGLAPGQYRVWAYEDRDRYAAVPSRVVEVSPGVSTRGVDAAMVQRASVSGRVTFPATTRPTDLMVQADIRDGGGSWDESAHVMVGEDGRYRLRVLESGE